MTTFFPASELNHLSPDPVKMAATALHPSIFPLSPSPYPNKTSSPISFNLKLQNPNSQQLLLSPLSTTNTHQALVARNPKSFKLYCSPAQETTLVAEPEKTQVVNKKRKLFVGNLPRTSSVEALKELFGQCGNVTNAEFVMNKNETGSNFGSVTFATGEEAQAAIEKFDSYEIEGRTIKVEFAKRPKKFSTLPSTFAKEIETEHQLYVYNLAWKVRGRHLREFFNDPVKAVSSRVIFDERGSAGYGFVSFATREEAEAALSALNGKELMGRPIRLKLNNKQGEDDSATQADTGSESAGEDHSETGPDDP